MHWIYVLQEVLVSQVDDAWKDVLVQKGSGIRLKRNNENADHVS
jgi:hypothetical protein